MHIGIVVEQPAVISIFTTRLRNFYLQVRCKETFFSMPFCVCLPVDGTNATFRDADILNRRRSLN